MLILMLDLMPTRYTLCLSSVWMRLICIFIDDWTQFVEMVNYKGSIHTFVERHHDDGYLNSTKLNMMEMGEWKLLIGICEIIDSLSLRVVSFSHVMNPTYGVVAGILLLSDQYIVTDLLFPSYNNVQISELWNLIQHLYSSLVYSAFRSNSKYHRMSEYIKHRKGCRNSIGFDHFIGRTSADVEDPIDTPSIRLYELKLGIIL